ncbi:MAG: GspH/FimT family pseudopilin [Myxococcota bacterium]
MGRGGFSIAELLVVVAVLAIAGLVLVGHGSSVNESLKLELAAEEVASALRFARSESMRTGDVHGARIDTATQRILVYRLDTSSSPPAELNDVYHPVDKKLYDVGLAGGSFTRGVSISQAEFRFRGDPTPYASVAFDPTGIPISPLDLAVMESGAVDLDYRGMTNSVTLMPPSGRVRIQ